LIKHPLSVTDTLFKKEFYIGRHGNCQERMSENAPENGSGRQKKRDGVTPSLMMNL
jgi:hypothetical protein